MLFNNVLANKMQKHSRKQAILEMKDVLFPGEQGPTDRQPKIVPFHTVTDSLTKYLEVFGCLAG